MVSIVVDNSVSMTWCFRDELTDETKAVLYEVTENGAVVPPLWKLEVANALQNGVRRGRIDAPACQEIIKDLSQYDIQIDQECERYIWTTTMHLAQRFKLTIYDACYLELAQRHNLPLATLDRELRAAAHALGVPLRGM